MRNPNAPKPSPIKDFLGTNEGKVAAGVVGVLLLVGFAGSIRPPSGPAGTGGPAPDSNQGNAQAGSAQANAAPAAANAQPQEPKYKLSLVNASYKIVETNSTWWKYAYKIDVKNETGEDIVSNAKVNFQDKDGFTLETEYVWNHNFQAGKVSSVSGFALLDSSYAGKVKKIAIE
jgi:hypothetical protein